MTRGIYSIEHFLRYFATIRGYPLQRILGGEYLDEIEVTEKDIKFIVKEEFTFPLLGDFYSVYNYNFLSNMTNWIDSFEDQSDAIAQLKGR